MKINVQYQEEPVVCKFMPYGLGEKRLWITDPNAIWYQTVGRWCPHINLGYNECSDCSLVLEGDNDQ